MYICICCILLTVGLNCAQLTGHVDWGTYACWTVASWHSRKVLYTHTQLDRRRWGYLGLWRPETAALIKPWLFSVTMSAVQYFELPGLRSAQKTVRDQIWVFPTAGQIYKFPPLSEADLWNFRFQLTLHHKIYSPRSSCAKSSKSTGLFGPLLFAALARPCNAFKTLLHAVPWYALGLADWGISWHRQRLLTNVIGVGSAFGGDNWGHQHLNRPQYLVQQTTRRGCSGAWQQKCRNNLLGKSERATV